MAKAVGNVCMQENGKLPTTSWQDLQKRLNW